MMIAGKHYPNITCLVCHFRHPAEISCNLASQVAEYDRNMRENTVLNLTGADIHDDGMVMNRVDCRIEKPLWVRIVDRLTAATDEHRAIMTDLLWKFVRGDWHGVMDAAVDLRELEAARK